MKKTLLLFTILISALSSGQSIKATYKVQAENIFNTSRPDTLPEIVQKTFKEAERSFANISYKLEINSDESFFSMEDMLLNEADKKAKLAKALAGFSGKIYSNKKENLKLRQTDVYGQVFIISSEYDQLEWNITKETRQINGFKAYKAFADENYDTGEKTETWKIVAWFVPELNQPFGPGGYGGLPGLIVELQRAGKIYTLSDYKRVKKDLTIAKPEEGRRVTQKEFENIGRKMSLN